MGTITRKYRLERETKATGLYHELNDRGEVIEQGDYRSAELSQSVYVKKSVFSPAPLPKDIEITVSW